jgi:hypothetical protein
MKMGAEMEASQIGDETLFDRESIIQLSPEKREEVIRLMVKQTLDSHPEGMTAFDVAELCGLSLVTARKHLDFLTAVREAYEKTYRPRFSIYFPNGRLVHPYSDSILNAREAIYSFQRLDNTFGKFIYVQERKKDAHTGKTKTVGGILIETQFTDKFIEKLRESSQEWTLDGSKTTRKIGR